MPVDEGARFLVQAGYAIAATLWSGYFLFTWLAKRERRREDQGHNASV